MHGLGRQIGIEIARFLTVAVEVPPALPVDIARVARNATTGRCDFGGRQPAHQRGD
jgi:hypothetical protein